MVISSALPTRAIRAVVATVAFLFATWLAGPGTATGAESTNHLVDASGRTVRAVESDTRIDFVAPLDQNPTTRYQSYPPAPQRNRSDSYLRYANDDRSRTGVHKSPDATSPAHAGPTGFGLRTSTGTSVNPGVHRPAAAYGT